MDLFNEIADEIVTTGSLPEPRMNVSSQQRRAVAAEAPRHAVPAAPLSEMRSTGARQQATQTTQPRTSLPAAEHSETRRKPQKRATEISEPTTSMPAPPLPADGGADEANDFAHTNEFAPRRQPSSVVHSSIDTQRSSDDAQGRAMAQAEPIPAQPAPFNPDGHVHGDTQSNHAIGSDEAVLRTPPTGSTPRRKSSRARKGAADRSMPRMQPKRCSTDPTPIDAGDGVGRSDHPTRDAHSRYVAAAPNPATGGGDDRAQPPADLQRSSSPVVAEIVQLWRMRTRWWKAELKLILQAQAICRAWTDGDKAKAGKLFAQVRDTGEGDAVLLTALAPFIAAMKPFADEGAAYEKRIAKLARQLPVYPWVKSVWGFSDLALGKIVGEAGDIGSYRSPSCLWKRMGLAVINGIRQRRVTDADEALLHGYNAQRRSTMWNIGNGLIGGMGKGVRPFVGEDWQAREDWSPYQKLYVGRLIYLAERDPEAHARPNTDAGKMSFSKHAHNDAKRYVEKRALRDLWSAWRAADRGPMSNDTHTMSASVGNL